MKELYILKIKTRESYRHGIEALSNGETYDSETFNYHYIPVKIDKDQLKDLPTYEVNEFYEKCALKLGYCRFIEVELLNIEEFNYQDEEGSWV